MIKRNNDNIKGEIIGIVSDELKKSYAKELARILIKLYDKEFCEKIAEQLSIDFKISS
jgi:hypothetical protein